MVQSYPLASRNGTREIRRGTTALDDRGLLEACHDGDLDACRTLTARHTPGALRVAYLLTGNKGWAADLVCESMIEILRGLRRGRNIDRLDHELLVEIVHRWEYRDQSTEAPVLDGPSQLSGAPSRSEPIVRRTQNALARLDDHQRAAIALHVYGGLPVGQLADALNLSSELIYVQIVTSRTKLVAAAELESSKELLPALNAVALNAPRLAVWSLIEIRVHAAFEAERRKQRRLSVGVAAAVCGVMVLGVALVSRRGGVTPVVAPTPTVVQAAAATPTDRRCLLRTPDSHFHASSRCRGHDCLLEP